MSDFKPPPPRVSALAVAVPPPLTRSAGCCGDADLGRLGRCTRCVVMASVFAVAGWAGVYLGQRHHAPWWLSLPVLAMTSLFSLLLVAHALAALRPERQSA